MATEVEISTRSRLLQAAMALFAERGYAQTTIAAISQQAEANVAAVNYHFGDKQSLYVEALRTAHRLANEAFPVALPEGVTASPQQRLRQHIHAMISQIFSESEAGYLSRIVAKEFAEPSFAVDLIFSELIGHNRANMRHAIEGILGDKVSEQRIRLAMVSVVSQFYNFSRLIREMGGGPRLPMPDVEVIAEHIYDFSIAGMRGLLAKEQSK